MKEFIHSRTVGIWLVWILFILAIVGTYVLSKNIEMTGGNSASVFMITGRVHEVSLYKERVEPTEVRVRTGDEILFLIKDESRHNIAEDRSRRNDARLESGEFSGAESYSLIFQTKGSMSFYDRMNQDIRITVVVE